MGVCVPLTCVMLQRGVLLLHLLLQVAVVSGELGQADGSLREVICRLVTQARERETSETDIQHLEREICRLEIHQNTHTHKHTTLTQTGTHKHTSHTSFPDHLLLPLSTLLKPESKPPYGPVNSSCSDRLTETHTHTSRTNTH